MNDPEAKEKDTAISAVVALIVSALNTPDAGMFERVQAYARAGQLIDLGRSPQRNEAMLSEVMPQLMGMLDTMTGGPKNPATVLSIVPPDGKPGA